jgi:hypothetical protein
MDGHFFTLIITTVRNETALSMNLRIVTIFFAEIIFVIHSEYLANDV